MDRNLQLHGFKVYKWLVDGSQETICEGCTMRQAADEFWHYSNNVSANVGITTRVMIVDALEDAQLLWEYGRGYTYNGKLFRDRPVLDEEITWQ